MRTVLIEGKHHIIPDNREYRLQKRSSADYPIQGFSTIEYLFRPRPCNYVEIRQSIQKVGFHFAGGNAVVKDEWKQLPREPLAKYLVIEPNTPDQSHLQYGGMETGADLVTEYNHIHPKDKSFHENFANYEKGFLAALDEPLAPLNKSIGNPCSEQFIGKSAQLNPNDKGSSGPRDLLVNFKNELPNPPKHKLLDPDPNITKEIEDMSGSHIKFPAGTRVIFTNSVSGELETGTVVGRTSEMERKTLPSEILIATDRPSKSNNDGIRYTGKNHGFYFNTQNNELIKMNPESWELVPTHIGVISLHGFVQDSVKISKGRTGRIIKGFSGKNEMVRISWNFSDPKFASTVDASGTSRHNIWAVPASKLGLCFISRLDGRVRNIWPNRFGQVVIYKVGDLCKVAGGRASVLNKQDREVMLREGTVVELLKQRDKNRSWHCRIIGRCSESTLNRKLDIQENIFRQLPDSALFYRQGQNIEIVAEVDFRKKPLQGMTGKVILSTDEEGDVGIEFPEDIGAGSLDGIGKEGHCIYIEASLVKSSE